MSVHRRPFDDNWGLEDPTGRGDEEFREVIAEIETRVKALASAEGEAM